MGNGKCFSNPTAINRSPTNSMIRPRKEIFRSSQEKVVGFEANGELAKKDIALCRISYGVGKGGIQQLTFVHEL
jgi:hypothetical protein